MTDTYMDPIPGFTEADIMKRFTCIDAEAAKRGACHPSPDTSMFIKLEALKTLGYLSCARVVTEDDILVTYIRVSKRLRKDFPDLLNVDIEYQ